MDPITLTILGIFVAVITLIPTTLGWLEARRQRRLAERALPPEGEAERFLGLDLDADKLRWRCGIYEYPPLSSWPNSVDGDPSGPLVLLGKKIAEAVGRTVTFERFEYDDFYRDLNSIPDMIVGMFETKRRTARVSFSRPIYEIGLQGICRIDQKDDALNGLRDGNLLVAVYSGEVGWEFVNDELPDAVEQHRVATLMGGRQLHTMALLTERIYDIVIMDHLSCVNFLNKADNRQQFRLAFDEPPQKYRACIAVKKEHSNLLQEIDPAIVKLRNEPAFLQVERQALDGLERVVERRALRASPEIRSSKRRLQPTAQQ